jgi:hypothetical protein
MTLVTGIKRAPKTFIKLTGTDDPEWKLASKSCLIVEIHVPPSTDFNVLVLNELVEYLKVQEK